MYESSWRSPSNIAFVKYWGKKQNQIPANPSVSMTLKECFTETKVRFTPHDGIEVKLLLDGKSEERFANKILSYLKSLNAPEFSNTHYEIKTRNTFPHGTGIASSASGLSAFGLCLTDYSYHVKGIEKDDFFIEVASSLSRMASGSACRSVYGGFTTWGKYEDSSSSDLFATPLQVHESITQLRDTILIVSNSEKSVSSTAGHERMKEHAYAATRFVEARNNFTHMVLALKRGDLDTMGAILENEALQLHAMMMTAPESFILMKPNTLTAIELIRDFRFQTKLPLYFTLDAGPNLHLIYPEHASAKIRTFITHELKPLTVKIIEDQRGEGPKPCN
jgi:diphosphomevalonate decarboxylase